MLFVDARKLGRLVDRTHRELTDADLSRIAGTYHLWRGGPHPASGHPLPKGEGNPEAALPLTSGVASGRNRKTDSLPSASGRGGGGEGVAVYRDIPGFCKSATIEDIRRHGHVLTPGRYVGAEAIEDDGEPFDEKMKRLTATLRQQQAESARLDQTIRKNLKGLGYEC